MEATVITFPLSSHLQSHRNLHDSLVSLMFDFNNALKSAIVPFGRLEDGTIDFRTVSISDFYLWAAKQATKTDHEHEEIKNPI